MATTEQSSAIKAAAKRTPQQSSEARLDRTLRISGLLETPKAEPCRDVELISRVLDALSHLP